MAKRRTKEQVASNAVRLDTLFRQNTVDGKTAKITFRQLFESGYEGSMPYTIPSGAGDYLIKQNKREYRTSPLEITYSILKMFMF